MSMAFVIAQRSLDKMTKHGCVIVDESHTILSVGYNGPPRGFDDSKVPLERPAKYAWLEHSESNSIINAARSGIRLLGSIFYITGRPCMDCFRKIINVGAVRVICGPIGHQIMGEQSSVFEHMVKESSIEVKEYRCAPDVIELLEGTVDYIHLKIGATNEQKKSDTHN